MRPTLKYFLGKENQKMAISLNMFMDINKKKIKKSLFYLLSEWKCIENALSMHVNALKILTNLFTLIFA